MMPARNAHRRAPQCRRIVPDRDPGPAAPTGRRASRWEIDVLGRSTLARCMNIWLNLHGASCDFDDLVFATAEALAGPVPETHRGDFCAALDWAASTVDAGPWRTVRIVAVDVWLDLRGDRGYDPDERTDWRRADELVDDVLFSADHADGDVACRACALGLGGSAEDHRDLAGLVAFRGVTWAELEARAANVRAGRPADAGLAR